MHYHSEIVIPPTDDVKGCIERVLQPFSENEENNTDAFWDWWTIGGRWAGAKSLAQYDLEKMKQFRAWCESEKVTVRGFIAGKEELFPTTQIPAVDAKWNEMFPTAGFAPCPLFKHSGDKIAGDIMALNDVPITLTCERVIFCGPSYQDGNWTGQPDAIFMLCQTQWNGCNHMPINWDGMFGSALSSFRKDLERSAPAYQKAVTPLPDWLVVTVDYHS